MAGRSINSKQLYSDAARSARIMALVVHPYIMGAPHRLKHFRAALTHIRAYHDVLFWTGEEIRLVPGIPISARPSG